jgi:alginate O-acetyltransferase complex protein AlgI
LLLRLSFWITLTLATLVYWRLPLRARSWFLGVVSFLFLFYLAGGDGQSATAVGFLTADHLALLMLLVWSLLSFRFARTVTKEDPRARVWKNALIVGLLGYLGYFKYFPEIFSALFSHDMGALFLPVGISYYTFKLIHFNIEAGRGKFSDCRFGDFLAYITLFPAFTAGPIERFDHFQRNRSEEWSWDLFLEGTTRLAHGLIKKFFVGGVLLGNLIAAQGLADVPIADASSAQVWSWLFLQYLWVYIDFSAYTDIAIGASLLFGVRLVENFNWPIFAENIGGFWKRWHMSLAAWCQAYIYLPAIGWSRNPYVAVFLTFFVIGLWHGAGINWVLWGLYHGLGVAVYLTWAKYKRRTGRHKRPRLFNIHGRILTNFFVAASFALTMPLQGAESGSELEWAVAAFLKALSFGLF